MRWPGSHVGWLVARQFAMGDGGQGTATPSGDRTFSGIQMGLDALAWPEWRPFQAVLLELADHGQRTRRQFRARRGQGLLALARRRLPALRKVPGRSSG